MEISKFFVGREKKDERPFRRLFFRAAEGSGKTATERLHGRTSEACPLGEDRSGRVDRLPQELNPVFKVNLCVFVSDTFEN